MTCGALRQMVSARIHRSSARYYNHSETDYFMHKVGTQSRVYSKRISFCISPRAVWYYSLPWGVYSNVRREMIDPIGELYGLDEGQSGQSKCASTWAEQRAGQPSVSKRRERLVKPGSEYTLMFERYMVYSP